MSKPFQAGTPDPWHTWQGSKCLKKHIFSYIISFRVFYIYTHLRNVYLVNQAGGELIDFIIVLRSIKAVKAFSGRLHVSIGAGVSACAGPLGRAAEVDLRVGTGGAAACYTYSCSQGMLRYRASTIISTKFLTLVKAYMFRLRASIIIYHMMD